MSKSGQWQRARRHAKRTVGWVGGGEGGGGLKHVGKHAKVTISTIMYHLSCHDTRCPRKRTCHAPSPACKASQSPPQNKTFVGAARSHIMATRRLCGSFTCGREADGDCGSYMLVCHARRYQHTRDTRGRGVRTRQIEKCLQTESAPAL